MRPPDPASVLVPGPWTHREVSANGIRLHVAEAGDGPLVLLLHGFPEFWWSWRHQLITLAEAGLRAVAVDLRGYGDSDKPPRGYDGWTLAGDVAGLIRALGEPDAALVGRGWGGVVAWTTAALHPRLVRSIAALAAPHPLALRHALLTDRAYRATRRAVAGFQLPRLPERRLCRHGSAQVERMLRAWGGPEWPDDPAFDEVVRRTRNALQIPGVAHRALEYYRWAGRSQLRPDGYRFVRAVAQRIDVPVLAVHGRSDPRLTEATVRASAAWTTGPLSCVAIDRVGHFVQQEAPARTGELLTTFLER